jgi:hypothetical protein
VYTMHGKLLTVVGAADGQTSPNERHSTPPQSLDVSKPSVYVLLQVTLGEGFWHVFDVELQWAVVQSPALRQLRPMEHSFEQMPLPQSTSTSMPSLMPFEQLTHLPATHEPLLQSLLEPQVAPSLQATHEPPQSTADSSPSLFLLSHETHFVWLSPTKALWHRPDLQSLPALHFLLSAHCFPYALQLPPARHPPCQTPTG